MIPATYGIVLINGVTHISPAILRQRYRCDWMGGVRTNFPFACRRSRPAIAPAYFAVATPARLPHGEPVVHQRFLPSSQWLRSFLCCLSSPLCRCCLCVPVVPVLPVVRVAPGAARRPGCASAARRPGCAGAARRPGCASAARRPGCAGAACRPGCASAARRPGCAGAARRAGRAGCTSAARCAAGRPGSARGAGGAGGEEVDLAVEHEAWLRRSARNRCAHRRPYD